MGWDFLFIALLYKLSNNFIHLYIHYACLHLHIFWFTPCVFHIEHHDICTYIVTRTRDAILFVIGRSEFEGGWSMCRHFMQRSGRESSVEKGVVNRYAWVLIVCSHISPCPTIYCVEFSKILHFSCRWIFICSTLLLHLFCFSNLTDKVLCLSYTMLFDNINNVLSLKFRLFVSLTTHCNQQLNLT